MKFITCYMGMIIFTLGYLVGLWISDIEKDKKGIEKEPPQKEVE